MRNFYYSLRVRWPFFKRRTSCGFSVESRIEIEIDIFVKTLLRKGFWAPRKAFWHPEKVSDPRHLRALRTSWLHLYSDIARRCWYERDDLFKHTLGSESCRTARKNLGYPSPIAIPYPRICSPVTLRVTPPLNTLLVIYRIISIESVNIATSNHLS